MKEKLLAAGFKPLGPNELKFEGEIYHVWVYFEHGHYRYSTKYLKENAGGYKNTLTDFDQLKHFLR